jgi:hypothetical protein
MNHTTALGLSIVLGSAFYVLMEKSIPTDSNCSYLASPVTDILAFAWGFIVMWYGISVYDNPILTTLGATVIVEHVWQLKRKGIPQLRKKSEFSSSHSL